nr:probable inactive leucine-rich repeat receptor kinase XIAO [Aegilops tauschii subsp. strangulata]
MTRLVHLAGAAALFLLAAAIPATTAAVVPSEADALLAWKASLIDAAGLSTWTRATPVCDWDQVYCDKERVVELSLYRLGLSGGLDTLDTLAFPALTILGLGHNNLSGTIPVSISRLRSLETLDLSNTTLSGPFPHQLCELVSLRVLHLSNNHLSGELPNCWCNLQSLRVMDLSSNGLIGKLPDCWWNLEALEEIDLSYNSFSGEFPVAKASHNCSLTTLHLTRNSFVGPFPFFEGCDSLHHLSFMDLSNNRLTGKLPYCLWNLESLLFMDLSHNSFSGIIPAPVASHNCSLRSLYLAGNGFVGVFPPVLEGCNLLTTLDMGNNMFFGVIPPWIGSQVPLLRILSLRSNNFTGEIPPELSGLSQLQVLDMADNSLTGSIPVSLGSLTSMKHPQNLSTTGLLLEWKYNDRIDIIWKGKEQKFQRAIGLLAGIDLSDNLLSRCIPKELTNLQGLQFLNLSRNHLSCNIPENIGSLTFLESLDLSFNELTGEIPPSISSLLWLTTLNVSTNHLSGKIPIGSQIQTLTDPSIYSNNSGLCGFPLDILCEKTPLAPNERNVEEEDQWLYYFVIAGIVFGFWLWFGMLFTIKAWRCAFLFFVDGMQCKTMKKVL